MFKLPSGDKLCPQGKNSRVETRRETFVGEYDIDDYQQRIPPIHGLRWRLEYSNLSEILETVDPKSGKKDFFDFGQSQSASR